MESVFETQAAAPLLIGGWPDMETATTRYAIEIPYALSFLAHGDPKAVVKGLDQVTRADWPHVPTVHLSFQAMVALGTYMAVLSLWVAYLAWRRRDLASNRRLLQALALGAPMGFLAIEAGWLVTEVGRQPWIINGVQRTSEAVTPMPGLIVPFLFFTLLYIALSIAVVWLMRRQILQSPSIPDQRGLRLAEGEAHA
jgi:cytochrome d ubiquinol oxidase subunit I